jgi:hypothetical protein
MEMLRSMLRDYANKPDAPDQTELDALRAVDAVGGDTDNPGFGRYFGVTDDSSRNPSVSSLPMGRVFDLPDGGSTHDPNVAGPANAKADADAASAAKWQAYQADMDNYKRSFLNRQRLAEVDTQDAEAKGALIDKLIKRAGLDSTNPDLPPGNMINWGR